MSSPERGTRGGYEEPYYSQYGTRGGSVTPIIDEEQRYVDIQFSVHINIEAINNHICRCILSILFPCSDVSLTEDQYALYGHKTGRIPRSANQMYDPTR